MFRRIVVGADGSPEGKDAVVLGAAIAAATGAGLTLLGAFPPFSIVAGATSGRNSQSGWVDRQLSALRRQFAPSAHVTSVGDANAARALLIEAQSWRANLIVIGSSRQAEMGRCAIGETGRRLLNKMPSALAIAKRGLHQEAFALSRIAVGYDGGPESDRALQLADLLAAHANAGLFIESVNKDPVFPFVQGGRPTPAHLEEIRNGLELEALNIAKRAAARTAAPSKVNASIGEPGSVLRDISEGVDLMVIGSRRWGVLPRVLLGGVGEALATDCGASLIIVGMPADHLTAWQERPYADVRSQPASSERPV